ncbi:hypothetical protein [Massilia sp. TS11]|uniref:hypothetical protein n=1 Tax=Massilia sp. TS11 TaxID=2908003 RepID=UPI001EDBB51D|nr:hypothetical protein [Massilia sp. TS11]MCG2585711.1 hypothetical protein [Massilia sp. TS11]
MKRVHPEFAYQARELEGYIDGILGDPPDKKNYQRMLDALLAEYAKGKGIEDLNMMAFALNETLRIHDAKALLREAAQFEEGDAQAVFAAASADGAGAAALEAMIGDWPELTRQAIITVFLHKHPKGWVDEDNSLDALREDEDEGDEDDEIGEVTEDFAQLFDQDEE